MGRWMGPNAHTCRIWSTVTDVSCPMTAPLLRAAQLSAARQLGCHD